MRCWAEAAARRRCGYFNSARDSRKRVSDPAGHEPAFGYGPELGSVTKSTAQRPRRTTPTGTTKLWLRSQRRNPLRRCISESVADMR